MYRYWLVAVVMAAPRQIRIWVRKPAGRRFSVRSHPMAPPQISASSTRTIMPSISGCRRKFKELNTVSASYISSIARTSGL